MDKEKEIQEMARAMCTFACDCEKCSWKDVQGFCHYERMASLLYSAGYRNAVNIIQGLYDQTFELKDPYSDSDEAKKVIDREDLLWEADYLGIKGDLDL